MHTTLRLAAFAATMLVGLVGAQAASPADPPQRPGPAAGRTGDANALEQRITALRAKLQITTAQEPQWNQFVQVMRDNAKRMDDTFQHRAQGIGAMNAEDNMASYAQVAMSHAQGMQNLVPAFHALYASMTDLQKRAADQVFRDDAHRGGPGRGRQGAAR